MQTEKQESKVVQWMNFVMAPIKSIAEYSIREREKKKQNLVKHDSYYSTATYHKIAGFVVVK